MNNERFAVPELLFHPSDIGKEDDFIFHFLKLNIHIQVKLSLTSLVIPFRVCTEMNSSHTMHNLNVA